MDLRFDHFSDVSILSGGSPFHPVGFPEKNAAGGLVSAGKSGLVFAGWGVRRRPGIHCCEGAGITADGQQRSLENPQIMFPWDLQLGNFPDFMEDGLSCFKSLSSSKQVVKFGDTFKGSS